ncbi:hypothetical protein QJQ45_007998 [Haematococcus lacustris]|nr:hypothetical protein QJQ45_007998 [Haematococcus lacustris]
MLKHMQEWHAANNTVLSCSQFVKAELRLPGVTVPCQLNVMPSLLPDFDVLLGNDWLNEHEAVMSYQDKTLSLACDKSEPVVLPCPSAGVSQSGQSAVSNPASFLVNALRAKPPLASAKVAARWLRKGGTGVLALITVDNSSTPDPAPAEPDLPPGVSQALNALLDEYADVFAPITSLPPERPVGHAIPLVPDARPSVVPQYRMSQDEHAELKKQVQDLLAKGMIEPSSSPFAAPILFVKKKSGELRMCLDYRQLNKITIRDQYPLPRIDDLFDKLSGCTVFSSLDLQAGYNQIRITPEDVPKTAFRTPDGHYQFKVLSFGLCNAPATFQRVMNDAFAPVLNQCALVYLDDILVMSKSVDEHLKHLRKVFDLLRLNKLYAKQSKCEFMRTTLKFLGHVIFAGAIAVDPEKIKSISSWPVPQSLQQLQSFLGAANFVRKFVHNFSVLAAPLTDLCGKAGDSFLWHNWPADELKAFASLKAAVAQVPMLRLPDHTQPFQVYCDASLQGVGAVLMQDGYPLAYLSKKLSSAERNYTTGEQELLALITACKEWRCYLEGVPFTLFTDHKPLTALPTQKVLSRRQARWMEFLSRFTFDLQYLPGDANPADPLSRIPAGPQDCAMVCVVTTRRQAKQSLERGEVRVAQALPQVPPVGTPSNAPTAVDALAPRPTVSDNPVAAHHSRLPELEAPSAADTSVHYPAAPAHPLELADHLVHGYRLDPAFTAEADLSGMYMDDHGLWRRTGKGTVMVPNDPELREYILHEMHDAAYAGHVGITKTLERLSRVFYWDTMRADVRHYVTTCDACQRDKSSTLKPGGLLNPLSIPDYRWESVSMDLITKLPSASHGYDAICVFVDRLSKMVHFVPCKESMNAKGFARLFVDNVFKLHGLPKDMVSDRGPHFHNTFWHHVQKLLGMRGSLSSSYHPQSDGQTERYNRVLEEMLRHYISPTQADWPDYLSLAEFAVNNSWQESIKSTPFLVNTGQSPITPMLHSLPDKGRCPEGLSYATWWQEAVAKAKLCMQAAQQRQAAYANQDRRDVHYKVGQMVLLSTKNMRLKPGKARKLLPRFVGPFKVLDLVGQVAVNLQLPASMSRLHPVFHVSLIKPYTGTDVGFMPPPVEWLDEEPVYYVERLLDHRHVHAGKAKEYLVQWEGYDADHNTWEPRSNLVGCDKILAEYNAAHNLKFRGGSGHGARSGRDAASRKSNLCFGEGLPCEGVARELAIGNHAEDAVIPKLGERNLFLQLGRNLPHPGRRYRPNAVVEDVMAAYPHLHARLNVVPRYEYDANTVDNVGTKPESSFANCLTELFPRRLEQAVALAGARVIAGSHEHRRHYRLPTLLELCKGMGRCKPLLARMVTHINHWAVDTSRELEEPRVNWQADWADWQAVGGQRNTRPFRPPFPFAITPGCSCKAHHIKIDTHALHGLLRTTGMVLANVTLEKFRSGVVRRGRKLGPKDSEPNLAAVRPNVGQIFGQVVHTDEVANNVMFTRPKPAEPSGEQPCMGMEEGVVDPPAHLDSDWLGCDPGKTNSASVAHEERYPSGAEKSVWQRSLIAGQHYRQSGMTENAKVSKA